MERKAQREAGHVALAIGPAAAAENAQRVPAQRKARVLGEDRPLKGKRWYGVHTQRSRLTDLAPAQKAGPLVLGVEAAEAETAATNLPPPEEPHLPFALVQHADPALEQAATVEAQLMLRPVHGGESRARVDAAEDKLARPKLQQSRHGPEARGSLIVAGDDEGRLGSQPHERVGGMPASRAPWAPRPPAPWPPARRRGPVGSDPSRPPGGTRTP